MSPGTMGGRIANASPIIRDSGGSNSGVGAYLGGIETEGGGTAPTREDVIYQTGGLTANEAEKGMVRLASSYRVVYIVTSAPARVRLYTTTSDQDRDYGRPITYDPYPGLGITLDYLTASVLLAAPIVPVADGTTFAAVGLAPPADVPITVTSVFGGAIAVTLTYFPME